MEKTPGASKTRWRWPAGAGILLLTLAASASAGEPKYMGIFGKFGDEPYVVIEMPESASVGRNSREFYLDTFGKRVRMLEKTTAKAYERKLQPLDRQRARGLPKGFTVFSVDGQHFSVEYSDASKRYAFLPSDPAEVIGSGGSSDAAGAGADGAGGGGSM